MEFTLEETGQPPALAVDDRPPSEPLANALRLYQRERYLEASVQLSRVVSGESDDSPANVQKAQFFLAKALFHLRFHRASLSLLEEIAQAGPRHGYFEQALPWLAQLATQLPEPAGIIELVGLYPPEMVDALARDETREVHDHLLYLSGRHAYAQNELDTAIARFDRVSPSSPHFVRSRFFAGVTHVRLRRARPAIAAFRQVLDAPDVPSRMRNLAWLSLARVYYTAANRTDEMGNRTLDPALLENALAAWDRVEPASEHWLDALFEQAWGLYLANQESRAMGNVFTLQSPYFEGAYYPEAYVIKAVVFFSACQTENAEAMITQFHERYDPVREELGHTLEGLADNEALYRFLVGVREDPDTLGPRIRGIVSTALADRTLLRHLEYVRVLDDELARLEAGPEPLRASSLGDRIRADLTVTRSFAVDRGGDLVRGRFTRLVDELDELMTQMDTVEVELLRVRREGLSQAQRDELERIRQAGGLSVEVDEEHQIWPFDGEYWRDELPFYRQRVTPICTR
ncbi:MAG: hypothetical protein H6719_22085 [Sandaracinaceae bacterium]|nr:hypothetical protein [Sandaracinaceae bacterium]